jgi:hypothetical protein
MESAKVDGDADAAKKIRYQIDELIGHELGHALMWDLFRRGSPLSELGMEGLAELIGYYMAQKVNERQTDNDSVAKEMLELSVIMQAEGIRETSTEMANQWVSYTDDKKKDALGWMDSNTLLSLYSYAVWEFAKALKSNPGMSMKELIRTATLKPRKLSDLDGVLIDGILHLRRREEVRGLDKRYKSITKSKLLNPEDRKIPKPHKIQKLLASQSDLSTSMIEKANALLPSQEDWQEE